MSNVKRKNTQYKYWILTIPEDSWSPPEEWGENYQYVCGQLEIAPTTGYKHWQILCCLRKKSTLGAVRELFGGSAHCEPAKSQAAREYCLKDESSVAGTRFEFGEFPFRRNSSEDWKKTLDLAKQGNLEKIEPDVLIRYYTTLRRISIDYGSPVERGSQEVHLYWGPTGSGKSKTVFDLVKGKEYYLKAPTTKWWDGYRGQEIIIVDEFRGLVEVSHILKWLDRYPCAVEVKGCQVFLNTKIWYFTSNLEIADWYKDLDIETKLALRRRFTNIINLLNHYLLIRFYGLIHYHSLSLVHVFPIGDHFVDPIQVCDNGHPSI